MKRIVSILVVVAVILGLGSGGLATSMSLVQDGSMSEMDQHRAAMAADTDASGTCDHCQERHLAASCAMSTSHCSGLMALHIEHVTELFGTASPYLVSGSDLGQGIEPEASSPPPRV